MTKKVITLQDIKNECESKTTLGIYVLFTAVGAVVVLSMLVNLLKNFNTANLIGFLVFGAIFGGFFCYYLGIRNLVYAKRRNALVASGQIWFVIDEVTDKYSNANSSTSGREYKDFQLELKKYTAKTNKRVFLRNRKEFNAAHEGDPCILGFTKMSKLPLCVYTGDRYELSPELQSKVVEDMI